MACARFQLSWAINALVVIFVCGLIVILEMNWVSFPKIGFHCEDTKIAYKFKGDTVPFGILLAITIITPLVALLFVETMVVVNRDEKPAVATKLRIACSLYGKFLFGLLIVVFVTEAGKSIVSEPRPHFLDTCRPDRAVNCTKGYIDSYKCTNTDIHPRLVQDSFRSFPSGHSAFGFYFSTFLIWFLEVRIPKNNLIVPALQCICIFWALTCSLTRITDRRHHWWDVLCGSLCGFFIAYYVIQTNCKRFTLHYKRKLISGGSDSPTGSVVTASRRLLSSTSSYSPPPELEPNLS